MPVHYPLNITTQLASAATSSHNHNSSKAMVTELPEIKVLSLNDYLCLETRHLFLNDMRESLMRLGTFYIKDHGVPTEVTFGAMKSIRDYFALPLDEKKKMLIGNSRHFRGYKHIGEEVTNNQIDHREQLQFAPEQPMNPSFVSTVSPDYEGLQGPNQWPLTTLALVPRFKSSILEYMKHLEILSQHLMEAVSLSLNLDASYFCDLFGKQPYYRLKCARYPSVETPATIGCGAHKDTGFLTVLLQDMVGGLEGQDPSTGQWIKTRPIPGTFIVTMGESIEKLTAGLYHATVHRVLNNTSGQDRYSIPYFFDPDLSAKIPSCILPTASSLRQYNSSGSISTVSLVSLPSDLESCSDEDSECSTGQISNICKKSASDSVYWSNGIQIFETVRRCHPEVYERWYKP